MKLKQAAESLSPEEFERIAQRADDLLPRRLVRSAFEPHPIVASLPLFEEELYYGLASAGLLAGRANRAGQYYLNYMGRLRTDRPVEEDRLYRVVVEEGIATPDRIALNRGRRLYSLGKRPEATPYLEEAFRSEREEVKLEAQYLLARAGKWSRAERSARFMDVSRFTSQRQLAQDALLRNALQHGPEEPEFKENLKRLIREYPSHSRTDDALFWLGRGEQLLGNLDESLGWYRRTRTLERGNNHRERAAIYPALGLIWRQGVADLQLAKKILTDFVADQPEPTLQLMGLFWLGRIAEQQERADEARKWFQQCVDRQPFSYYGLRARMHLDRGRDARRQVFFKTGGQARKELREAYAQAAPSLSNGSGDIYSQRLLKSLENGLYRIALESEEALRSGDPPRRVQELTFEELDQLGVLTSVAVMMALRQDALAAADVQGLLTERLRIGRLVGERAEDWPLSLSVVHPAAVRTPRRKSALMHSQGFLRTAYPVVFPALIADSAKRYKAPAPVLYAVMRNESFFYPAALSSRGALGLFQFLQSTFDELDRGKDAWRLLEDSGVASWKAYLMNERLSIELGARWFAEKKLPTFDENPVLAILAHHSGDRGVQSWISIWKEQGWFGDLEMMIETFRKPDFDRKEGDAAGTSARIFARYAVADLVVAEALGLYQESPGERN